VIVRGARDDADAASVAEVLDEALEGPGEAF
jgi:hypothetical protein